jgi:hypothetical protein
MSTAGGLSGWACGGRVTAELARAHHLLRGLRLWRATPDDSFDISAPTYLIYLVFYQIAHAT